MSSKLQNYVWTHRRRAGLSQKELAFLLGCASEAKVSRYERFVRQPTLETALAYEVVFGVPARELFAGVYEQQAIAIRKRAALLKEQCEQQQSACTKGKLELLTAISSRSQTQSP